MPKKITIDNLAEMTQGEFLATRKHFEERLRQTNEHIRESEQTILRAIEGLEFKIASYASSWSRDFDRIHGWVEELDQRLGVLEGRPRRK